MKKLILSSVFAGLVLASGVEAAAPQQAAYGKFVINADFAAGLWANVYHQSPGNAEGDTIDKDDITKRMLIALPETKLTVKSEGGCSCVAFGTVVRLEVDGSRFKDQPKAGESLFRDTYVYARFNNVGEIRIGSQRDATYSLVGPDSLMGGTYGYNGYYGNLLKSTSVFGVSRKDRFVLGLSHANDTWYSNAVEFRSVRMSGVQVVANWKPSSAYIGRLGTYGDGARTNGAQNNLVSLGINYDNTFGDFRARVSAGGVYGISDRTDAVGVKIADQATSLTYRIGSAFSWKSLDFGVGWWDNLHTGFAGANKDRNAGRAIHGVVGYQFDTTMWKPRLSLGALWGWKNGNRKEEAALNFSKEDQTVAVSFAADMNIREGFRWFVEGTLAMLDDRNTVGTADKGFDDINVIVGTGLAVSQ